MPRPRKDSEKARAEVNAEGKPEVNVEDLDLGYLALFVGMRVNERVQEELEAAGFAGVRQAHGYVFQHLLGGARSISELAGLLGVTQQAASKTVAELERLGYLEETPAEDARVRRVQLSSRGRAAVEKARALRTALAQRFESAHGKRAVDAARTLLADVLQSLGGAEAVRTRRLRSPR